MIDLNCDMGESYGRFQIGNDDALFPLLTSCNIACGFHGGDPLHIERTIERALAHQVRIGAHPSYPDLMGFGRRKMYLRREELFALVKYQVAALKGMVESMGGVLEYVKPHGALYNSMAKDATEAETVILAIKAISPKLAVMGLAGSHVREIAQRAGLTFIAEAFADRRYQPNGHLVPREENGAVIEEPEVAAGQVWEIAQQQRVCAIDGTLVPLQADSFCIHGDHPRAVAILEAIHRKF